VIIPHDSSSFFNYLRTIRQCLYPQDCILIWIYRTQINYITLRCNRTSSDTDSVFKQPTKQKTAMYWYFQMSRSVL